MEQNDPRVDGQSIFRVKVFLLSDEGKWDVLGTGLVSCRLLDNTERVLITVRSEKSTQYILQHIVKPDIQYELQGRSIIKWEENKMDVALSFQQMVGCTQVWEHIIAAQLPTYSFEDSTDTQEDFELPFPSPESIEELQKTISMIKPSQRNKVVLAVLNQGWFPALFELVEAAEDLECIDTLHIIFRLFQSLFLLNDVTVLEVLLSDECIMKTVQSLEWDPNHPTNTDYFQHRKYLQNAKFKEIIPFRDNTVLSRIHQNYKIEYIKDNILLRYLDDGTLHTLNNLIVLNNSYIISRITEDDTFMKEFFGRLGEGDGAILADETKIEDPFARWEARKPVCLILQELCNIAKILQLSVRAAFFYRLLLEHIIDIVDRIFIETTPQKSTWLWLLITDIIAQIAVFDSGPLRSHSIPTPETGSLQTYFLPTLVDVITSQNEIDIGLMQQCADILRYLLDKQSIHNWDSSKTAFLTYFLDEYLEKIISSVEKIYIQSEENSKKSQTQISAAYNSCELLNFLIREHSILQQYYPRFRLLERVAPLACYTPDKKLILSAIRFIRGCVSLNYDPISRRIVSSDLFAPIFKIFQQNVNKNNILNSAVLELMDYIRQNNIRILISYIVDKYVAKFDDISYTTVFSALKIKHEEEKQTPLDQTDSESSMEIDGLPIDSRWGIESSEDIYFSSDDEVEDSEEGMPLSSTPARIPKFISRKRKRFS